MPEITRVETKKALESRWVLLVFDQKQFERFAGGRKSKTPNEL
ncbi:protein of unknown function (plasmid) [Vibrio harveyi]|nr:protein of unknown function [Vibrio harveyi]